MEDCYAGEKWKEKEDEERGLAVASREPAREDRWRREPGNLGTIEFSRAKPPAATDRRRYTYTLLLGPRLDSRQAEERRASTPSKSASLA
ncbi:unnamed protein product [Lasius platythorax]|uniref:Uncharacterized protein n=1 Tax=Lasius platythorax TaxID=488582 RepID=A0AAV2NKC5_9HYME